MIFQQLETVIHSGEEVFKRFIDEKVAHNKKFLHYSYVSPTGEQYTILNYLILFHREQDTDLGSYVQYLIDKGAPLNIDQPLHLAYQHGKLKLAEIVLSMSLNKSSTEPRNDVEKDDHRNEKRKDQWVDPDSRDNQGYTLISRVIDTANVEELNKIVKLNPNINQASKAGQPLHQAIMNDFMEGISLLMKAGAQIENRYGKQHQTVLMLAADRSKINAMEALLKNKKVESQVDHGNINDDRAIDIFCDRLEKGMERAACIRGIAMLLSHGADAPRVQKWRQLLQSSRDELLDQIIIYLQKNPHLLHKFVKNGHDKNNPLHALLYGNSAMTHFFRSIVGKTDDTAFKFEKLVALPLGEIDEAEKLTDNIDGVEEGFSQDERRFAEFVELYNKSLTNKFFNPWSEMRWWISTGKVTQWQQVLDYIHEKQNSRSAKIVKEILAPTPTNPPEIQPPSPPDGQELQAEAPRGEDNAVSLIL